MIRGLRVLRPLLAVAALGLVTSLAGSSGAAPAVSYTAPWTAAPGGGDQYNVVNTDATNGRISMARVYPVPAVLSCGGASPYAGWRVKYTRGTVPAGSVKAEWVDAATDGYTFLQVVVRDAQGLSRGAAEVRGPLTGTGSVTAAIDDTKLKPGDVLTIDVHVKLSSACPDAGGGTVTVQKITVS